MQTTRTHTEFRFMNLQDRSKRCRVNINDPAHDNCLDEYQDLIYCGTRLVILFNNLI